MNYYSNRYPNAKLCLIHTFTPAIPIKHALNAPTPKKAKSAVGQEDDCIAINVHQVLNASLCASGSCSGQ
jgi:hypothetical protein